ncbi:MAG TPA: hypothetical protein VFI68_00970 [Anaerolineales bacterium]|nr:hypothetical protein [Anaerolineales bacterium]
MAEEQIHHEFDFWLGEWELTWGENNHGTNRIERILNGAVVQENFVGDGYKGMSVSVFSREDNRWHQTWVDTSGTYLDFVGDFTDGRMILTRNGIVDEKPVKQRMIWYNITKDKLMWNWERSNDNGTEWQVIWKIQYKRKV